ncbi:MAG: hypothetical protein SOR61_04020 [Evtepia sp.]|uniref:hypothetical protein n=1 Tax=Evtepia sp. TaxID=2773933 RepID=UPI002A761C5E|nr:hypothetical protein [Evtepia sp.]MDY3014351.1 hypothetical protein [Evtepia sp.]
MIAEKELDSYCQELRKHLLCSKAKQEDFIFLAKFRVSELQQENPGLTYDDVIDFLGEPQELAHTYMESLDDDAKERYQMKKKRQRRFVRILVGISVALIACYFFYSASFIVDPNVTEEQLIIINDEKHPH